MVSAASFAGLGLLPVLTLVVAPASIRIIAIALVSLVSLGLLGALGGLLLGGGAATATTAFIGYLLSVAGISRRGPALRSGS